MTDEMRDKLYDTKLQLVEQRIETRLIGIEAKIEKILDRVDASSRFSQRAEEAANRAEERADQARSAALNTRWNIFATALGMLAVLFAAWAVWTSGMQLIADLVQRATGQ